MSGKDKSGIVHRHGSIRGFEITQSLTDTMRAIVNAPDTGYKEDVDGGGIVASFSGKEPMSSWQRRKIASNQKGISGVIQCPSLKADASLNRHQADLFVGFGMHELATMLVSDRRPFDRMLTKQGKQGAFVMKALEDARVDEAFIKSAMAGNAKALFDHASACIYSSAQSNPALPYDPNNLQWLPVTLGLMAKARRGANIPEVRNIRLQLTKHNLELLDKTIEMMDKAPLDETGSEHSYKAAEWLIEQLKLPPQPEPQQGDGQGQGQGQGKGKGQGQGKPTKGGDGKGKSQGQGKGAGGGKGSSGDGLKEDPTGKGDHSGSERDKNPGADDGEEEDDNKSDAKGNKPGEGEGDGDSQVEGGAEKGDNGEGESEGEGDDAAPQKPGDGESYANGGGGGGFSKHGSGTSWHEVDIKKQPEFQQGLENALNEVSEQVNKTSRHDYKVPVASTRKYSAEKTRRNTSTMTGKIYDQLKATLPSDLGAMRHALWRLMNSRDEAFVDRFSESGRWDNRAMPRMLTGSNSIYKQTKEVEGMRTCVSILLDLSGSMSGSAIIAAAAACIAISETLEQLAGHGVAYEICGFEDFSEFHMSTAGKFGKFFESVRYRSAGQKGAEQYGQRPLINDEAKANRMNNLSASYFGFGGSSARGEQVLAAGIPVFKSFNERLSLQREKLASMVNMPGGGTPDAAGLLRAVRTVLDRPEPNKIVMVMTDGCGYTDVIKNVCKFATDNGVDVIGVGIGDTTVKSVYPISITAPSIDKLGKAAFGKMVQVVMKNRAMSGRRITT